MKLAITILTMPFIGFFEIMVIGPLVMKVTGAKINLSGFFFIATGCSLGWLTYLALGLI